MRSRGVELPWMKAFRKVKEAVLPVAKRLFYHVKNRIKGNPNKVAHPNPNPNPNPNPDPNPNTNQVAPGEDAELKELVVGLKEGDWFYAVSRRQTGPVTAVRLYELGTSRQVPPKALVWCPRLTEWTEYREAQPLLTREFAAEFVGKAPQAKTRNSAKAAKRKEARFAAKLIKDGGAQLQADELAAAYKAILGLGLGLGV